MDVRGLHRWQKVLIAVLLGALHASGQSQDDLEEIIPVGCFSYGYKFFPAMQNISGMPYTARSVLECQMKCRMTDGCFHFAFFQKSQQCWFGDLNSKIIKAVTKGSVCGPAICPKENPACSGIPGPDFPASEDALSRAAWPGGEQPTNLQCWPRLRNGFPDKCQSRMATVLEDTAAGWPGRCGNLRRISDLQKGETCQLRCFNSALCGVWAVENQTDLGVPTCWHAMNGMNCTGGSPFKPMRAQRIMHGSFRVLMNTMGMQIMNLTRAFDSAAVTSVKEGIRRCRKTCLSYLFCQLWQYSSVWGCWLEDPTNKQMAYPLVNNGIDMMTEVQTSNTVKAGEYIQHFCADEPKVPLPTDSPSAGAVAAPLSGSTALAGVSGSHTTIDGSVVPQPQAGSVGTAAVPGSRGVNVAQTAVPATTNSGAEGGGGGGMPTWASFLVGFAIALALVAIGLCVWMTVIDADKQGTRGGSKYGRPGSSYASDSRASSFTSESQSMLHSQPYNHYHQGGAPPSSHSMMGWMHAHTQHNLGGSPPGYGQNGYMSHGRH